MIRAQIKFVPGAHLKHSDLTVQWWNTSLLPSFLSPLKVICALKTTSGIGIWSICRQRSQGTDHNPHHHDSDELNYGGLRALSRFWMSQQRQRGWTLLGIFEVNGWAALHCIFQLNIFSLAPVVLTSVNALTVFSLRLINCIRAKRWRSCFLFVTSNGILI